VGLGLEKKAETGDSAKDKKCEGGGQNDCRVDDGVGGRGPVGHRKSLGEREREGE